MPHLVVQEIAEIVVGCGKVGVESNGSPVFLFRFVKPTERTEHGTKIGMIRRAFTYAAQQRQGLDVTS